MTATYEPVVITALTFDGTAEHPRAPEVAKDGLQAARAAHTRAAEALAIAERIYPDPRYHEAIEISEARKRLAVAKEDLVRADAFSRLANSPSSRAAQRAFVKRLEAERAATAQERTLQSKRHAAAHAEASALMKKSFSICGDERLLSAVLVDAIRDHIARRRISQRGVADMFRAVFSTITSA